MSERKSDFDETSSPDRPAPQAQNSWVREQLEEAKSFAQSLSWEQIKDGAWFSRLLAQGLEGYANQVNAEYFRQKYPGLSTDMIVERQIDLAQKYAALSGGVTASAYSAAVVGNFASFGLGSGVAVPAALTSFAADVFFTTKIQLQLAYDMAILYGVPINLKDPDDVFNLIRVAFGIKAGEVFQQAAGKLSPEATKYAIKQTIKGATLESLKALPVVGRYLLQRNLIKFAVPVAGIAVAAGMNWFTTKGIGHVARATFRDRAAIRESALEMADLVELEPVLFMRTVRLVIEADGKRQANEAHFLADLVRAVVGESEPPAWVAQLETEVRLDKIKLFADLAVLPPDVRQGLYDAAIVAATVDREVQVRELEVLRELAAVCGTGFDANAIKAFLNSRRN